MTEASVILRVKGKSEEGLMKKTEKLKKKEPAQYSVTDASSGERTQE